MKILHGLFALLITLAAFAGELPDPNLTPGLANPEVTTENLDETICVPGYTKTIRPPTRYTNKLKRKQIVQYGYEDTDPNAYKEDYCIPLTLGTHSKDPHNLWPEPYTGGQEERPSGSAPYPSCVQG